MNIKNKFTYLIKIESTYFIMVINSNAYYIQRSKNQPTKMIKSVFVYTLLFLNGFNRRHKNYFVI